MAKKRYPPTGSRTPEAKAQREAYWRGVLDRWRASGVPKTRFSRREGISPDVLGWWQAQILKRDRARERRTVAAAPAVGSLTQAPAFVPVRVAPASSPSSGAALEVLAGGRVIRVRPGFDAPTLVRVLETLEGQAC